jgi:hypothetical protein
MSALDTLYFTIYHNNKLYNITAAPYLLPVKDGMPLSFETTVDGKPMGDLNHNDGKWENENLNDEELIKRIGSFISSSYQQPKTDTA